MKRNLHEIIVASHERLLVRRAIGVVGSALIIALILLSLGGWSFFQGGSDFLARNSNLLPGIILLLFVAAAALAVDMLMDNQAGLYSEGIAPPRKPLWGLLERPFIVRWADLSLIEVKPRPLTHTKNASVARFNYQANLKTKTGREIWFTGSEMFKVIRSVSEARKILEALKLTSTRLPFNSLDPSDPELRGILNSHDVET
jgi:hypothetical protein